MTLRDWKPRLYHWLNRRLAYWLRDGYIGPDFKTLQLLGENDEVLSEINLTNNVWCSDGEICFRYCLTSSITTSGYYSSFRILNDLGQEVICGIDEIYFDQRFFASGGTIKINNLTLTGNNDWWWPT